MTFTVILCKHWNGRLLARVCDCAAKEPIIKEKGKGGLPTPSCDEGRETLGDKTGQHSLYGALPVIRAISTAKDDLYS